MVYKSWGFVLTLWEIVAYGNWNVSIKTIGNNDTSWRKSVNP